MEARKVYQDEEINILGECLDYVDYSSTTFVFVVNDFGMWDAYNPANLKKAVVEDIGGTPGSYYWNCYPVCGKTRNELVRRVLHSSIKQLILGTYATTNT